MKRFFLSFLILLFLLGGTVCAAAPEYTLTLPDGFVGADVTEDKTALADRLGMTAEELDGIYRDGGLLYAAADETNTKQFRLSVKETEFSRAALSFSRFTSEELDSLTKELKNSGETSIVTRKDGRSFLCVTGMLTDSGGKYRSTDYLTVCSGKLYTLHITASDSAKNFDPEDILDRLTVRDDAEVKTSRGSVWITLLCAVGIAVFAAVAVWLTVTVIRDLRNRTEKEG